MAIGGSAYTFDRASIFGTGTRRPRPVSNHYMNCLPVWVAIAGTIIPTVPDSPGTYQFEYDSWENQSWGLHNVSHKKVRCEMAVALNGSRSHRCDAERYHHYIISDVQGSGHVLYAKPTHECYSIDHKARTVGHGSCLCKEDGPSSSKDSNCARRASSELPNGNLIGFSEVAGVRVVEYRGADYNGRRVYLSLAPSLGCEALDRIELQFGKFGIPTLMIRSRITSFKPETIRVALDLLRTEVDAFPSRLRRAIGSW